MGKIKPQDYDTVLASFPEVLFDGPGWADNLWFFVSDSIPNGRLSQALWLKVEND